MCCNNNRRAARYERRQDRRQVAAGGIASIIGAIQEIRLAGNGMASRAPAGDGKMLAPETAELDRKDQGFERGVVYDQPYPSAAEEKKQTQRDRVPFEELPTYEASTGYSTPGPVPREQQPRSQVPETPRYTSQSYSSQVTAEARLTSNPNLERFRTSLIDYSNGARGAKKDAKWAAKKFVKDLKAEEIKKVREERRYLEPGEQKEIKRELRPVKEMLKGAVREVKAERKGRY